ncbi:MAG: hypothetical protein LBK08_11680 [Treponema sp.]|nr:hypothetical protein [Treponema sp.]
MADQDNLSTVRVNIGTVYIDQEAYIRVRTKSEVFEAPKRFLVEHNTVYIHFDGHLPAYVFMYKRYGAIQGFATDAVNLEGFTYLPDLIDFPPIAESADPLSYAKMQFNSGSYEFNNTRGEFDSISDIFGNRLNVLTGQKGWEFGEYKKLIQYYISNISFNLNSAVIEVKDIRELLSSKIPPDLYTKEEYPFLNDSDVDKVKQDAYGFCYNVKGTCINWKDIYVDEYQTLRTNRTFRFARAITDIEYIEIKQGGSQIDGAPASDKNQAVGWTQFKRSDFGTQGISVSSNGTITIDYYKVFPLKNGQPDVTKKTYEVRATGTFVDIHNPGAIIKDIMSYYGGIQADQVFDNAEFDAELGKLPDIGICLDKQEEIYAVIEKIQKGSLLGFQFMGKYDKYTARLDNPNRAESPLSPVSSDDILNLDEIEINMNADLYATYTDIKYEKKWYTNKDDEEDYLHEINKSKRMEILDIHRLDKAWEEETLLNSREAAALKGTIILDDFSKIRPVISNIKLFGLKWFSMRPYDIITIDFAIHGKDAVMPRNVVKLFGQKRIVDIWANDSEIIVPYNENGENKNNREFIGSMRYKVLSVETDTKTGIVTLSVRQQDRSRYLGAEYD